MPQIGRIENVGTYSIFFYALASLYSHHCNSDTISDRGSLRAQFGLQGLILLSGQAPAYTSHWKNQPSSVLLTRTGSVEQSGNLKDDIRVLSPGFGEVGVSSVEYRNGWLTALEGSS